MKRPFGVDEAFSIKHIFPLGALEPVGCSKFPSQNTFSVAPNLRGVIRIIKAGVDEAGIIKHFFSLLKSLVLCAGTN